MTTTTANTTTPLIAVLPGDGVGVEVVEQGLRVLNAVAAQFGWRFEQRSGLVGGAAIDAEGTALPDATLELARQADAVYFGAVGGPKWDDPRATVRPEQGILGLRKALDLYANLRPVKLTGSLLAQSVLKEEVVRGTDMLVIRELTGGLYFSQPSRRWQEDDGTMKAVDTLLYTEQEIDRVVRTAFEFARQRRKKVTSVDKANVLNSSRLWREVAVRVGKDFPDVQLEHVIVDAMSMYLIRRPSTFDVIVTENMFGDILTDEASVLAGSMGMLPSASLGTGRNSAGGVRGLYEPIHGTAPDIVGTGKANPLAAILSGALMLRYSLNQPAAAQAVEDAVQRVLEEGYRTPDIAGAEADSDQESVQVVTTEEMGRLVADRISQVRIR